MSFQYKKADPKQWTEKAAKILDLPPEEFKMFILTMYDDVYDFAECPKSEIMNKIEVENKYVFLIQLSPEERAAENRIQLTIRMCKKTYYGDDYDTIWFKRPFFFSGKDLKGIDIYKRILKYLYNDTYDNSKKRSRIMSGKSLEEYMKIMLNDKPFELVFKYKKSVEHYYHRKELKFDK